MNRVLLVYPPSKTPSELPPIGIASIASYVMSKSPEISVRLIDFTVEEFSAEGWGEEVQHFQPDVVGISVLTLNYPSGRLIAELTKQLAPNTLVVMGGVHATMRPEECLEHCDIVVRGEGEETFYQICQGQEWENIKGISFKNEGKVIHNEPREPIKNLDDLPFGAHFLIRVKSYKSFPKWSTITSRGCPYECTFCCTPQMWGRAIRSRCAKNIADELEYLHSQFGIQHVDLCDDIINIPQRRAFEICEEIISRGLHRKMGFSCSIRANKQFVSLELFQKMKEANFKVICLGIESASEKVLKLMRKNLTLGEVRQAIKMARKADIDRIWGFLIVGNWGETIWDVLKTWRFVLANNVEPQFSICTPYPGTGFYHLLKNAGYLAEEPDWSNFNQSTPLARTNKMSRLGILIVYLISLFIQSALFFFRGRRAGYVPSRVIWYASNRVKLMARSIWELRRTSRSF